MDSSVLCGSLQYQCKFLQSSLRQDACPRSWQKPLSLWSQNYVQSSSYRWSQVRWFLLNHSPWQCRSNTGHRLSIRPSAVEDTRNLFFSKHLRNTILFLKYLNKEIKSKRKSKINNLTEFIWLFANLIKQQHGTKMKTPSLLFTRWMSADLFSWLSLLLKKGVLPYKVPCSYGWIGVLLCSNYFLFVAIMKSPACVLYFSVACEFHVHTLCPFEHF